MLVLQRCPTPASKLTGFCTNVYRLLLDIRILLLRRSTRSPMTTQHPHLPVSSRLERARETCKPSPSTAPATSGSLDPPSMLLQRHTKYTRSNTAPPRSPQWLLRWPPTAPYSAVRCCVVLVLRIKCASLSMVCVELFAPDCTDGILLSRHRLR